MVGASNRYGLRNLMSNSPVYQLMNKIRMYHVLAKQGIWGGIEVPLCTQIWIWSLLWTVLKWLVLKNGLEVCFFVSCLTSVYWKSEQAGVICGLTGSRRFCFQLNLESEVGAWAKRKSYMLSAPSLQAMVIPSLVSILLTEITKPVWHLLCIHIFLDFEVSEIGH